MRARQLACAAALCAAVSAAAAQWSVWENDYDSDTKSWKEIQAQIPPYPKPQNLVPVQGGSAPHHAFVDAASLSVGEDGVVRYTLVVKAAGGATNVTFEGMRCETRELKRYAHGRSDGAWLRAHKPDWQRIVLRDLSPYHYVLYREYFCPSPAAPTPPRLALDALRRGEGMGHATSSED